MEKQSICLAYKTISSPLYNYQLPGFMDNIALEVYVLSCILPLLAFLLLAIQFYCDSTPHKTQNAPSLQLLEQFPCHIGGLISIANQFHSPENSASHLPKGSECTLKADEHQQGNDRKYLRLVRQQALQYGKFVLNGCNAGLAKMIYLNRLYFASRKTEAVAKYNKELRKKKSVSCAREWFQPTRLVTIVEGLQY